MLLIGDDNRYSQEACLIPKITTRDHRKFKKWEIFSLFTLTKDICRCDRALRAVYCKHPLFFFTESSYSGDCKCPTP